MTANKQMANILSSTTRPKEKENKTKPNVEANDAIDTVFVYKNIPIHITIDKISTTHKPGHTKHKPAKAPTLVATPLPPLNLRKQVQICPQITHIAARIYIKLKICAFNITINNGAIIPFKKSKINTAVRKFKDSLKNENHETEAKVNLNQVYSLVDKAAKKNIYKKNKASRVKERLTALLTKKS